MAGTLIVSNDLCWMAQNWVHDNVLEVMAEILRPNEPDLAATLLDSRTSANGGFLDLRSCGKDTIAILARAAGEALKKFEKDGAGSFYAPESYPGFMKRMEELKQMLAAGILG